MPRVTIKPELVRWARERADLAVAGLSKRFRKLEAWERDEVRPTFKQLEAFAKATHAPFGYFFLPEPPEERLPIPDFRTVAGDARPERPSPEMLDTIYAMQRRQAWLRETLVEGEAEPLAFVGSARLTDAPEAIGREMRRVAGFEDGWARDVDTWQEAVSRLRQAIEELGVMAVINGVVGNNTHRPLDVAEFRGFALSHPYAPLIFVNGADAKSAQMFTLAHELAHVWLGREGVSGFEDLFPGGSQPEADPDDARELLNYRKAFELVAEYLDSGAPITEGLVREIHRRLVEGVRGGTAAPGQYRRTQNYVVNSATGEVIYTPPPAHDVPVLMVDLIGWLNQPEPATHPVLVSGVAQFELVHIHPFLDGNGRTSRLLSTLCLYRAGYDFKRLFTISEYYDRDRAAFYTAIESVREHGMDMTGWLEYFVEGLAIQLSEVRGRGERVIRRDVLVLEHGLSDRQAKALGEVLEHGELTIQTYEALCPDANRRTLQRDLKLLVEKELLAERGSGPTDPTRRYVPGKALV